MDRATLTARYLDEIKRRSIPARELIGSQAQSDFLNTFTTAATCPGRCSLATPSASSCTLQVQEFPLALQATGVASQLSVAPDDPVAGNEDGERIAAHGGTGLLSGHAVTQPPGQFPVAGRVPVADLRD
jgi:hypothetical protein